MNYLYVIYVVLSLFIKCTVKHRDLTTNISYINMHRRQVAGTKKHLSDSRKQFAMILKGDSDHF